MEKPKIVKIEEVKTELVTTNEEEYNTYTRYSVDNWEVLMGNSWEPFYDCRDLEKLYREFKKR